MSRRTVRLKTLAVSAFQRIGYDVARHREVPDDFTPADTALVEFVRPYTMTSPERIVALARATEWIVDAGIRGAFVECGVWRGGSMMTVARSLLARGETMRDLYLFDTFEGMTAPAPEDRDHAGQAALDRYPETRRADGTSDWCRAEIDEVKRNLARTGYPENRIHYVVGRVEDTVPATAPDEIALLRLDTDWYESTRHEMEHLWPRVSAGGVCILDDYGHWQGVRKAVDEYVTEKRLKVLMHRIDNSGRVLVNVPPERLR